MVGRSRDAEDPVDDIAFAHKQYSSQGREALGVGESEAVSKELYLRTSQ